MEKQPDYQPKYLSLLEQLSQTESKDPLVPAALVVVSCYANHRPGRHRGGAIRTGTLLRHLKWYPLAQPTIERHVGLFPEDDFMRELLAKGRKVPCPPMIR
jgi:hypothetical protein